MKNGRRNSQHSQLHHENLTEGDLSEVHFSNHYLQSLSKDLLHPFHQRVFTEGSEVPSVPARPLTVIGHRRIPTRGVTVLHLAPHVVLASSSAADASSAGAFSSREPPTHVDAVTSMNDTLECPKPAETSRAWPHFEPPQERASTRDGRMKGGQVRRKYSHPASAHCLPCTAHTKSGRVSMSPQLRLKLKQDRDRKQREAKRRVERYERVKQWGDKGRTREGSPIFDVKEIVRWWREKARSRKWM